MTLRSKFTAKMYGHIAGTPPAKGASQSAPAVTSASKEPNNDQLRERLKDDILSKGRYVQHCCKAGLTSSCLRSCMLCIPVEMLRLCRMALLLGKGYKGIVVPDIYRQGLTRYAGGTWDAGWQVESKMRTSGSTAGTWDSVRSWDMLSVLLHHPQTHTKNLSWEAQCELLAVPSASAMPFACCSTTGHLAGSASGPAMRP